MIYIIYIIYNIKYIAESDHPSAGRDGKVQFCGLPPCGDCGTPWPTGVSAVLPPGHLFWFRSNITKMSFKTF